MKKVVRSFEEPTDVKTLSNYVDSRTTENTIRNHRYARQRHLSKMQRIESAEVDKPSWWDDPAYDVTGKPVPEPEDVSVIDEFDAYVTQRFAVLPNGDWDVNAFPEDEKKWNGSKWSGEAVDYDTNTIGEAFWELLATYLPEDMDPGTYEVNCYVDMVFEIDNISYDSDGFVLDYTWPKLNLNDSTIKDIELNKLS